MKYVHLTQWSPRTGFGGYETIIRDCASGMRRRGDIVHVICRREQENGSSVTVTDDGVVYTEAYFPMKRRPSTLDVGIVGLLLIFIEIFVSMSVLLPALIRTVRSTKTDAVIFYGIHLMLLAPIVRLLGSKAVLGLEVLQKNQDVPVTSPLYWLRRFKYSLFDGIFTYTKLFSVDGRTYDNITNLIRYAGPTPVSYIPWGIDIPSIRFVTADSGLTVMKRKYRTKILICPRRLVEEKGVRYLVRAIPLIRKKIPDLYVVFAGDGVLRSELERMADDLKISPYVRFEGFLSHEDTLSKMKASDIVVVPSSGEESFGMVFLESYALGVPIVSTNFGGIANVVTHGTTGLLVPPKDPDALAAAIVTILTKPDQAKRFVTRGKMKLRKEFAIDVTLDRLDTFIRSL